MRIHQWLSQAISCLLLSKQDIAYYDKTSAQLDSELLLAHHLKKARSFLATYPEYELNKEQLNKLNSHLQQLVDGYPLVYLLGTKAFWDMDLSVNESTLIPRADTEVLIEYLMHQYPKNFKGNILDLGTGSGAIAIALSRIFENAKISALDNSLSALEVAYNNAKQWQKSLIDFYYADWFSLKAPYPIINNELLTSKPLDELDIIISNPPYIDKTDRHLAELSYEPITALVAEDKGLSDLNHIISHAKKHLKSDGLLVLEHGYNQTQCVQQLLQNNDYLQISTHKDLAGNARFSTAKLGLKL